jgi:type I site-specific restriction endonuclease
MDPAQGPGARWGSNPEEKERKNQLENELQQRVTELEQQLKDEREARESVESQLKEIREREHAKHVEETLKARIEAGLVDEIEQERERLTAKTEEGLNELLQDALKLASKQKPREATPKAKYTAPSSELKAVIEDTRQRLFGRRSE